MLPSRGTGADSIRAILQRDLDFGDRVNVIDLDASSADGRLSPLEMATVKRITAALGID